MAQSQVWLITGASRGLGFDMAKIALNAGHKVIACYRGNKPQDTSKWDELEALGGIWTQLDVSSEDAESKVAALVMEHGRIDVLVNNAGYAILGSIEDVPLDKVHAIFNTNFIGTLRTIKGVLPSMRKHKAGTIVNISSSNAITPVPALGIYTATKCAMEGYTETLQMEVAAFGIRVLLIEPGSTATEFASETGSGVRVQPSEPYQEGIVRQTSDFLASPQYAAMGAPSAAVAERIVEAVDGKGIMAGKEIGLRLLLGKDTGADTESRAALFAELANRRQASDVYKVVARILTAFVELFLNSVMPMPKKQGLFANTIQKQHNHKQSSFVAAGLILSRSGHNTVGPSTSQYSVHSSRAERKPTCNNQQEGNGTTQPHDHTTRPCAPIMPIVLSSGFWATVAIMCYHGYLLVSSFFVSPAKSADAPVGSSYQPDIISLYTLVELFTTYHVLLLYVWPFWEVYQRGFGLRRFVWSWLTHWLMALFIYTIFSPVEIDYDINRG
ncbi:hypothetical protein NUW58_g8178 [Xylaria curta]|uniref:Uncharacterized protein n=1 Tax=Xylaria curta TaxID=42375 RepID=A0ACC1NAU4_9PEZI|nr:hypothetical protein NUW58_g8178 [Xylaria curta]